MAGSLRLRACGLTDVGRQREHNEDSLALVPDQGLFVVADGMADTKRRRGVEPRDPAHRRLLRVDERRRLDVAIEFRQEPE